MFTKEELEHIEAMANEKLIHVEDSISRLSKASFSFAYAVRNKESLESIIEKVRKM